MVFTFGEFVGSLVLELSVLSFFSRQTSPILSLLTFKKQTHFAGVARSKTADHAASPAIDRSPSRSPRLASWDGSGTPSCSSCTVSWADSAFPSYRRFTFTGTTSFMYKPFFSCSFTKISIPCHMKSEAGRTDELGTPFLKRSMTEA